MAAHWLETAATRRVFGPPSSLSASASSGPRPQSATTAVSVFDLYAALAETADAEVLDNASRPAASHASPDDDTANRVRLLDSPTENAHDVANDLTADQASFEPDVDHTANVDIVHTVGTPTDDGQAYTVGPSSHYEACNYLGDSLGDNHDASPAPEAADSESEEEIVWFRKPAPAVQIPAAAASNDTTGGQYGTTHAAVHADLRPVPRSRPPPSAPTESDQLRIDYLMQEQAEVKMIALLRQEISVLKATLRDLDATAAAMKKAAITSVLGGTKPKPVAAPRPAPRKLPAADNAASVVVPPRAPSPAVAAVAVNAAPSLAQNPFIPVIPALTRSFAPPALAPPPVSMSLPPTLLGQKQNISGGGGGTAAQATADYFQAQTSTGQSILASARFQAGGASAAPLTFATAEVIVPSQVPAHAPAVASTSTLVRPPPAVFAGTLVAPPPPATNHSTLGNTPTAPAASFGTHSSAVTWATPAPSSSSSSFFPPPPPAAAAPASPKMGPALRDLIAPVAEMCEVVSMAPIADMELVVDALAHLSRRFDLSLVAPILQQGGWDGISFRDQVSGDVAKRMALQLRQIPLSWRAAARN